MVSCLGRRVPAEFSQCPFWFWNDTLDEAELVRQIGDFQAHGVEAFVIHPRIGLPRSTGWLSDGLFHFMRVALTEARRRGMWALLYDEGMYPSGSAGGLVVAQNPGFQARGLVCVEAGAAVSVPCDALRLRRRGGAEVLVFDRPVDAVVRGLHYVGDEDDPAGPGEEESVAADLLNPEAVRCFIGLVYDRFYRELGEFFGGTVRGIFTDEPNPLSRLRERGVRPGTRGIVSWVSDRLGRDFTPHLPALWFDDEPEAERHRRDYREAIAARMGETYYRPLARWCEERGVALTGHPAEPDEIGHLRHLHIPGQDIVWRQILPGTPSTLEGAPSTMAKAAASVKFHLGLERNLNEFAGAYGEELTFEELRWLASWLLIRGCDLLVPHAFYYSMRGPRRRERPPDTGPNSAWWPEYRVWADTTRRLCWLNATFAPVCEVAILGRATELPWRAARACFERQIDFHYLAPHDLPAARVESGRLRVGPGSYAVVIVEEGFEAELPRGTSVLRWGRRGGDELACRVAPVVALDAPAPGLRARRLRGEGMELFLLFNEGEEVLRRRVMLPGGGLSARLDLETGETHPWEEADGIMLPPHDWAALVRRIF